MDANTAKLIRDLMVAECVNSAPPPDHVLYRLISMGRLRVLARGQMLISVGDFNPHFHILVSGVMRRWHWDGNTEKTSAFATAGTQTLIYHCYYAGRPSVDNVEACSPCRILTVRKPDFDALLADSPEFALYNFHMAAADLYFHEMKRDLFTGNARERYLALMRNRPEFVKSVSQRILASYLGITPQYLSNIRKEIFNK